MKLKIKPSEKINRRYILFEGSKKDVESTVLDYLGILGWAKASPMFVKSKVLAIDRKAIEDVRAAFAITKKKIKILKVSGTIKGLSKK